MQITSVDLGNHTGIVSVNTDIKKITQIMTVALYHVFDRLNDEIKYDKLILEGMPSSMGGELYTEYFLIRNMIPSSKMIVIKPGEWKPISKARKWTLSCSKSQHEEDAYNMIRFFLLKENSEDIGEWECIHE